MPAQLDRRSVRDAKEYAIQTGSWKGFEYPTLLILGLRGGCYIEIRVAAEAFPGTYSISLVVFLQTPRRHYGRIRNSGKLETINLVLSEIENGATFASMSLGHCQFACNLLYIPLCPSTPPSTRLTFHIQHLMDLCPILCS